MIKAIVTIKLKKNKDHNPHNKKTGYCPITHEVCTDITGEHHSYIETGSSKKHIELKVRKKWRHITRIEIIKINN